MMIDKMDEYYMIETSVCIQYGSEEPWPNKETRSVGLEYVFCLLSRGSLLLTSHHLWYNFAHMI